MSLPISNAWPERGASAVKRVKTQLRSRIKNDMLQALMQVSIYGPNIGECESVIKTAVKKWMPNQKKLAKGKPIVNEVLTTAAAAVGVLVRLDGEPEDTSTTVKSSLQLLKNCKSHQKLKLWTKGRLNLWLRPLKLTQENDSDIDCDFEDFASDEESDSELVLNFGSRPFE